ncbi:HDOD domain-containing protein [Thalassotalea agariperforans]
MFKKLVKFLFPSANKGNKQNFYYFEENRNTHAEEQEKSVAELQTALASKSINLYSTEEKYQKLFYDFLFGQSPPSEKYDELSLYIANQVEKLLSNPKHILASLPAIPPSLAAVLEQLNDKEFDADVLVDLIKQEPIIAAKVIELANSSFYNRSSKEISDLKTAFMLLGVNGLMEGVINGFVSKLAPQTLIYFKQYGTKIWQHSLATGVVAKTLLSKSPYKSESAQGYLIGLICNLGDMIIYQLLIESFSFVNPDCQPNSFAFKDLMFKNSKKITYFVAKHWNFPSSILDALALQAKLTKSSMLSPAFNKRPVACYIYEANFISEIEMMFQQQVINNDDIHEVIESLVFSNEAKNYLSDFLNREALEKV